MKPLASFKIFLTNVAALPFRRMKTSRSIPGLLKKLALAAAFGLGLLIPQTGLSAFVSSLADSGADTLRDALVHAVNGETIYVQVTGTVFTASELVVDKSVTIRGPGPQNFVVSANPSPPHRVFSVSGGTVIIFGLTVSNGLINMPAGQPGQGAGIYNSGTLTLSNCTLVANRAFGGSSGNGEGGGIYNLGALTVLNCILSDNRAVGGGGRFVSNGPGANGGDAEGGGLYNYFGELTLVNCTFTGNEVQGGIGGDGAGVASGHGNAGGNGGLGQGGALFHAQAVNVAVRRPLELINCSVSGNTAIGGPGGMGGNSPNNLGGNGGNGSNGEGGGVYSLNSSVNTELNPLLINCTVTSNYVRGGMGGLGGAGGIPVFEGEPGFDAGGAGGGIASLYNPNNPNNTTLQNTIVAGNISRNLNGVNSSWDLYAYVESEGHNLIGVNTSGQQFMPSDLIGIPAAPLDPRLGLLQDNGGPTWTHALLPDSLAIDTGDDTVLDPPLSISTDQRGHPRRNRHVDIGAYEYEGGPFRTNHVLNTDDDGPGSLREAIRSSGHGDTIDFVRFDFTNGTNFVPDLSGTITLTTGELLINHNITIDGSGADRLTVSGNAASRVFNIRNVNAAICGLTIANALGGSSESAYGGGAIYHEGTSSVCRCFFVGNSAATDGGGIYHSKGSLTVVDCTFATNRAPEWGGAIFAFPLTSLDITNSTFIGNGVRMRGGAVSIFNTNATLNSCTFSGNVSTNSFSGGLYGLLTAVRNCLIAGNSAPAAPDVAGLIISGGYNLISRLDTNAVGFGATGDLLGTLAAPIDAKLGPLQNNGGPTPTLALLPGSPALDAGHSGGLSTDQRGGVRPVVSTTNALSGDGSDIGAFEFVSGVRIVSVAHANSDTRLRFLTADYGPTNYYVQRRGAFTNGAWADLSSAIPGRGGPLSFTDTNATAPQGYYRVRVGN